MTRAAATRRATLGTHRAVARPEVPRPAGQESVVTRAAAALRAGAPAPVVRPMGRFAGRPVGRLVRVPDRVADRAAAQAPVAVQVERDGEPDPYDPELRLRALVDDGSLRMVSDRDGSGVLSARGEVDGHPVVAFATDATRVGGAVGSAGCRTIVAAIEAAVRERVPVIGLWHSAGVRLAEGVAALDAVGQVFAARVRASGRVPQISVVLGPVADGAAFGLALTDVVVLGPAGRLSVTGAEVPRSAFDENDLERLGVAAVPGRPSGVAHPSRGCPEPWADRSAGHGRPSGVAHLTARSDADALAKARALAALLGAPGRFDPAAAGGGADPAARLPQRTGQGYDVRPLIEDLLDGGLVELHAEWAPSLVTGLGRLVGRTVGVVANNPLRLAGCLDSASAAKAARFVRMCDSFGVPLVVLVDVPGYLPGVGQEGAGVIRGNAELLRAFAEAVVPRVTLVTRKAYGGAYLAMNSRALGATAVFAWPTAEVAVLGASAAVDVMHRRRLAAAPPGERAAMRADLVHEQLSVAGGVDPAVQLGVVDEIVKPADTRRRLAEALAAAPPGRGTLRAIPR